MRDSRLGTYGALGLILSLLRISAIGAIGHPALVTLALIAAAALSRAAMPVAMWLLPQARTDEPRGIRREAAARPGCWCRAWGGGEFSLPAGDGGGRRDRRVGRRRRTVFRHS
ncbi:MAG: adenosylcobinamide-GDP ribazoletransferase [Alphaproteobacteria bacterium]